MEISIEAQIEASFPSRGLNRGSVYYIPEDDQIVHLVPKSGVLYFKSSCFWRLVKDTPDGQRRIRNFVEMKEQLNKLGHIYLGEL